MEFWGVEVPSGKPLTCKPGPDSYVHVSQAALGEKKSLVGSDRVVLKVKVGTNEVVVSTLSYGRCDQTTLDLIFEKDFVLSHNSTGSVYFCGYKTDAVRDYDSSEEEDVEFGVSLEDEMEALPAKENGKIGLKAGKVSASAAKAVASKTETLTGDTKPKGKPVVAEKVKDAKEKSGEDDEDDDDENEGEDDLEDSDDEDEDMLGSSSDEQDIGSDDEDESDSEPESEEEPKSTAKKRPAPPLQAASAGKKGKIETPGGKAEPKTEPKTPPVPAALPKQQLSGKKDASAKKTPGKENNNTPASGKKLGQFFCQPCNKNFNSEGALSQHKTAKHK